MKKKRILLGLSAFALVGLATVLSSCDGDKKYTVRFYDGQTEIDSKQVTGGYNVEVPTAPTADGKSFNGWYKDAALTEPFYFGTVISSDTSVYAAWLNEYVVTFKSGDTTYKAVPVTKGYNVGVPTAPTKENNTFAGWYADAAFTTPFYFGTVIEADTTVYAKWISNAEPVQTYSITYVTEKGTAPATVEGVTSLPETLPSLTADGFTFGGWYLDQSFETAASAGTALTQNVTLYAKWVELQNAVTVSFVTGVDSITLVSAQTEKGGKLTALPTLADTVTNYVIEGFFTDENYNTPFTLDTEVADDMNVYVKLKAVYTVSFETSKGTAPDAILRQTKITVADLPSLSVDGYIFKGWAVKNTTAVLTSDVDIEADITLVAVLEAIPTIDTLKENGAEVIDSNKLDASFIEDYTRRGYVGTIMKASDAKVNNNTVILPTNSDNDVIVSGEEGSKVYELIDKGTGNNATYFYIDSFYSKGIVEAAVDFSITNQGNNWTFLRVNGTNSSVKTNAEIFGLRIDGGDIKYRLNNGSVETPLAKIAAENDKTYHIYLKADLDNGKMFVAINGKAFAEFEMENLSLDTISFVTSNSGSRTIKISGIALASDMEDADFVANIKARLAKQAEPYKQAKPDTDPVEYYYDQTEVNAIIEEATASIDAATKWSQFWVELELSNLRFSRLKTIEEKALDEAKANATQQFAEHIQGMTFEMKSAIESENIDVAADFAKAIKDLTTESAVIEELNAAKENATAINDSNTTIIEAYKTLKQTALETTYPSSSYTVEKNAYDQALDDLEATLAVATSKTAIDQAFNDADTTLKQIEKDTIKVIAKNTLENVYLQTQINTLLAKDDYLDEENHAFDEYRSNVSKALTTAKGIIDSADDSDETAFSEAIADAEKTVKAAVDAVRTATEWTVTFKKNSTDTEAYVTVQVLKDSKTSRPENDPTLDGYVFDDWDFDFETAITANTSIYAKWFDVYDNYVDTAYTWDLIDLHTTLGGASNTVVPDGVYDVFTLSNGTNVIKTDTKNEVTTKSVSFKASKISFTTTSPNATLTLVATAGQSKRLIALDSDITAQSEQSSGWTDTDLVKKVSSTTVFTIANSGEHYITFDNTEHKFSSIILEMEVIEKKTVTDISADVSLDSSNKVVVSNAQLSIKNSSEKISVASDDYEVYVDSSSIVYDNSILSTGDHTVTVKYGSYTVYSTNLNVTPPVTKKVTFMDGENEVSSYSSGIGTNIVFPTDVEKTGYQFVRYYKDADFTEVFEDTVIPANDTTVYMRYLQLNVSGVTYVSTAAELLDCINDSSNNRYTIYLTNDIDMTDVEYNGISTNFNSSVYGYGYSICNWNAVYTAQKTGFFGVVYQGTLDSITFKNCIVSDNGTALASIGLMAGQVYSSETITKIEFDNCIMNTAKSSTLGLLGEGVADNTSELLSLDHIRIKGGSISGTQYVGGLFGRDNNSFSVDYLDVQNFVVNPTKVAIKNAGGLVGKSTATISVNHANVDLTFYGDTSKNDQYTGGLFGYTESTGRITVNNTTVNIKAEVSKTFGGIIGRIKSESNLEVLNTDVTTSISLIVSGASGQNFGGVVGLCDGNLTVTNLNTVIDLSGAYSLGGVVGYLTGSTASLSATNVFVTGKITASNNSANYENTIVGYIKGDLVNPINYESCTYKNFVLTGATATLQGTELTN